MTFLKTLFADLVILFKKHGFSVYMIGGTSRDYLLGREVEDFDFTTDATPDDMRVFLPDANYRFASFGTVSFKIDGRLIEITTLRQEGKYSDARHPSYIKFVSSPRDDYLRRDININALYINEDYEVLDYSSGLKDLHDGIIRMIGDPVLRFQEDPLRIVRIIRFMSVLNFKLDKSLLLPLKEQSHLLQVLNIEKIKAEFKKVPSVDYQTFINNIKKHLTIFENLAILIKE